MVISSALLILFLYMAQSNPAAAITKDLGVVGTTYPVVEADLLMELQERSKKSEQIILEIVKKRPEYQPADLCYLPRARTNRCFQVDPTYTLQRDMFAADGKLLYPAGYTFNPLDYVSLPGLVVIDGNNPVQVEWFKSSPYFPNYQAKLLLSGGHAATVQKELQRPVYYLTDSMAKRLQLTAVPSVIIHKGATLQIREVKIDDADR